MFKFPVESASKICIAGDWHSDSSAAISALEFSLDNDADFIIQLGDFGIWSGERGERFLKKVKLEAKKFRVPIFFIDGNHENFNLLYKFPLDGATGLRKFSDYLYHLPRNYRFSIGGITFHALGGATSLDRLSRVEGVSWWAEEAVTEEEADKAKSLGHSDVLLMHDCPEGVKIPGIDRVSSLRYWPEFTLREAWAHREMLAGVASVVLPRYIFHGHFHIPYNTTFSFRQGFESKIFGLGDQNFGKSGNLMLISLDEISCS